MNFLPIATNIADYLRDSLGLTNGIAMVLAAIIHGSLLVAIFMGTPVFWIWGERKIAGRIQDRMGPTRVGGRFGWLQSIADGIKLIQKEDLVPPAADSMLFRMAPYMVCVASFATFMVLPFGDTWVAVASDIGLYVLVAILSLEVIGIILAGYSSGSKWSLFGGMREAAQMVSYEIPLAICAIIPVTVAGSLNLVEIAQLQSGGFQNWLIFNDPFTLVAFFVYFTVATASCKRAPFDLAEAESELVGGFHTEYSGMRWSFFFMGEYAAMFVVCAVASILFLGGWNSGIPPLDATLNQMRGLSADGSFEPMAYLANAIGMGILISKAWVLVFVQVWVRWTLPRLRIDQVMITCLKYLIPISCALFLGVIAWPLLVYKMTGGAQTSFASPKAENWVKPAVSTPDEDAETSQFILPNSTPDDRMAVADDDRKVAGGTR
ncbi:MAG: NADH-quinone oxidoreductase subunit NuoH [Planctomycetaceae bacterium]|nr:NADH-quinone oxidoreductase subunit NuoH [Planctomycetaceae bacterium]